MRERIKQLRKSLKLTQVEFGSKIGLSGSSITCYEKGHNSPGDAVILSICREFGCSEGWLRYGEGEMFVQHTRQETVAAFLSDVMQDEPDSVRVRFIEILSQLGPEGWAALDAFAWAMVRGREDPDGTGKK